MPTHRTFHGLLLAGIVTAALAVPAFANDMPAQSSPASPGNSESQAGYDMPRPHQAGDVSYISGGIGKDSQDAVQSQAKNYNLRVVNSTANGNFTADNNFVITGRDGRQLAKVDDAGPLFYAKLPAGRYTIRASNGQQQEVRQIDIKASHPTRLHLIWQQQS
ncbi:MAG TPA: hypothetical protein VMV79_04705 [Alphaproteobacteria bacterium]|nr:hypothetical protein [Alphaproteobacteria bacterium]